MKFSHLLLDVIADVKFFRDVNDNDRFFAEFENEKGNKVFDAIESQNFKSFLFAKSLDFHDKYNEVLEPDKSVQSLRFLLNYYQGFEDVPINVRTAGNLKEFIEYDLQSDDQQSIVVTSEGWNESSKCHKFIKSKASIPQVKPKRTSKTPLELLRNFVNVFGDAYILLIVWIIQAFIRGSHYILWVSADMGSGKSTLSKIIKKIIDPCKFTVTTMPGKMDDLRVLLNSTHLCCLDNLTVISGDTSDLMCGAVSGTAMVKRSLYTNSDIEVCTLNNTLVLNGIGYTPERDDLAERMLLLKLKKLSRKHLKSEKKLWADFDKALPEILGSIFNTLSRALVEVENINKQNLPRMTDAFIEMLAIAKALGVSEKEFRRIYDENQVELQQARLSSPVVMAVKEYMANISARKVTKASAVLYEEILNKFSGNKELLPASASHFTRGLDKNHADLLKAGFRINIDDTNARNTTVCIIRKK